MDTPHPLPTKFERSIVLTEAERHAISFVPLRIEQVRADQAVLREGARPKRSCLLVEGLLCNAKVVSNGSRQILAFHLPEDMPDLTSLHLEVRDSDTWALTDCTLAFIEHRDLDDLCDEQRRLAKFLWRCTLVDASVHREWTVNVGQREGLSRMAHLFCEIMRRMETIERAEHKSCTFPVTQEDLGEATGLSSVHVNRVLQELRRQKLISFSRGRLTIHDWDRLAELADFRDNYLHILLARPELVARAYQAP